MTFSPLSCFDVVLSHKEAVPLESRARSNEKNLGWLIDIRDEILASSMGIISSTIIRIPINQPGFPMESKWLITMVIVSPLTGVMGPLINGLFMAYKWR